MTIGETLFLALVVLTFASFAVMLAYSDHQYRASKRRAAARSATARDTAPSSRAHA